MEIPELDLKIERAVAHLTTASIALDQYTVSPLKETEIHPEIAIKINMALETLPDMAKIVNNYQPAPELVKTKFKTVFDLINEILLKMFLLQK